MSSRRPYSPDLFNQSNQTDGPSIESPLADRLRPRRFDDFVGQEEIVGRDRPLRKAIESDQLSSVVFWGPPGCGKTTLAYLIAEHTNSHFVPFSAVTGGIPELREIIKLAEHRKAMGQRTILFVDEIHRFNKA
ncbi:MAG TPA: AAA family ATPase, partial [Nitrospiraceae bacterium]|nr:AAA family ATPase [Nitrospiraceae bacterium]